MSCHLRPSALAVLLSLVLSASPTSSDAAAPPGLRSKKGMVATDHPLASAAGAKILRRGGNAVDAACAAAFALGVVNSAGSGVGGGGFMLLKKPNAEVVVIDFREIAPAAASRTMYLKPGLPPKPSRIGGLAVGVPGEVLGCVSAVKRFGKLTLRRVIAPAIRLARRGFPAGKHLVAAIRNKAAAIAHWPTLARILLPGGRPPTVGQKMRRPRLARTLSAIARRGAAGFYRGWVARDIVASIKAAGGILTRADLKGYRIKTREALATTFRGYRVYTMPPPSSGGVAIIAALNMLRHHPLRKLGHNSSAYLHRLTETLKHVFADRARYLGDADFVKVPVTRLTSQAYADTLDRRIDPKGVKPIQSYGSPAPARAATRDGGTSHLSVIDKAGFAVAMTTTINTGFGSMVVGKRSGVILNNQMDDFAAQPGKPNFFGLVQSEKNAIVPGKKPLSSMSPTIVVDKAGKVRLALGGSGGPTIISGTLQVLLNVIEFGLETNDAVSRARIHHQWLPDLLWVEDDLPWDVRAGLKRRGQKLLHVNHAFTAVQAVSAKRARIGQDGALVGASDPRKMGAPAAP